MAEATKSSKRNIPKGGGAKGGTRFPQIDIKKALAFAKKLVSKTHNGPQPAHTILVGVFNTKGPMGGVRASALKQYGLMEGDTSQGYVASRLARDIEGAIPEERVRLVQRAFLTARLFKQIYDTLQPETVSRARIRQVVISAKVHPDSADKCVSCFVDGAIDSGLGSVDGENIALTNAANVAAFVGDVEQLDEQIEETDQEDEVDEEEAGSTETDDDRVKKRATTPARSEVRVNLAVDSSSDPDKLEKQLKLLKQYGLLR